MRVLVLSLVLGFITGCGNEYKPPLPTYKAFTEIDSAYASPSLTQLYRKYKLLKHQGIQTDLQWTDEWTFKVGDADEVLQAEIKPIQGVTIDLPHHVNKPDWALWYRKKVVIPSDGFLHVRADDGAQLLVNGQQVKRLKENYFPVVAGSTELIVRVLNNAMSGGLRSVSFISDKEFQNYNNNISDFFQLKQAVEKILLLQNPAKDAIDQAIRTIDNPLPENRNALVECIKDYPFVTGPWLQRNGKNEFIIKAWVENNVTVQLRYGFSPDQLDKQVIATCVVCEFTLKDIPDNTTVFYELYVGKTISPRYHFSTKESDSFSFSIWADSQSGWDKFAWNISTSLSYSDAFGIGVGDLVGNGSDEQEWRMFFNLLGSLAAYRPYYLIAGNHDYDGYYDDLVPAQYNRLVRDNPTYQFWTFGNCAFIALDANERFPIGIPEGSAQEVWLHNQLQTERWKTATWRFVVIHQPPYSQGWPGYEGDKVIRDLLEPLMKSAKIDFVVSGHTHDYERLTKLYEGQKTTFLIVGGAGGSLESEESSLLPKMDTVIKQHHMGRFFIRGSNLRFEARDIGNQLLDSFEQVK